MKESKYIILCTKAIANEIDDEERSILKAWLAEKPSNRETYESIRQTWRSTERESIPFNVDMDAEWSKIQGKLSITEAGLTDKKRSFSIFRLLDRIYTPRVRWAYAGVAGVIVVLFALTLWSEGPFRSSMKQIMTPNAETREILLSDGSSVMLNCSSTLAYRKSFGKRERHVHLEGEGFFRIVPGTNPFVIQTDNAKTTVLGTEFNVKARNDETTVIVRRGSVRLSTYLDDDQNVLLIGGEMAQVRGNESPSEPSEVDVKSMLGWLEGRIVFVRTSFRDIIEELERLYDVTIELQSPQLAQRTITASYDRIPLQTILTSLCLTVDADFTVENERFAVRAMTGEELR